MTNHTQVAPSAFVISNISIKQDDKGRYCLNDLHRASGGEAKHNPSRFTRTDNFQALVTELKPEMAFDPVASVQGGKAPGTYVVKELVYAYAMWISASFSLKVIRAYDALHSAPVEPPKPEPTPLPPQLRTKILFTLDNGVTTQQIVPLGSCVIDPANLAHLKHLVHIEVPSALLPDLLELVSQRIAKECRRRFPQNPAPF